MLGSFFLILINVYNMDVITLRKLTRKSLWTYGKYDGYTVNDIMITNKTYLIWAYYNFDKISFVDEILDEFANTYAKFKLINKPGKDLQYFEDNISRSYATMTAPELRALILAKKTNGQKVNISLTNAYRQAKINGKYNRSAEIVNNSNLRSFNHGHAFNVNDELIIKKPKS